MTIASTVLRSFGLLNILFAAWGGYLLVATVKNFVTRSGPSSEIARAFTAMTTLNVLFLTFLVAAGISLLKLKANSRKICNWLFSLEIAYFVAISVPWGMGHSHIGAASGVGNMGIAPQFVTGYPIIALIAVNVAGKFHTSQPTQVGV